MKKLSKKAKQLVIVGLAIAAVLAVGYVFTVTKKTPTAVVKTTAVDTVATILKDTTKTAAIATETKAVEAKKSDKK